jgi:ABC-type oligopeptide transport system substrate-binding subunit
VIGRCIHDRYRLDAELGRGGMGVVYRALDTLLDRPVAVKVVSKAGLGTEGRARLMNEARAAARLNHPNVISVHDAGESEGLPFIVMELAEGTTLHERRPAELDDIVSISRQICAALEHAHAHGVVHRDLKPENVQIAPDGTAKLSDFGLARSVASRVTSEGTIVGSVFYLAPELALGKEYDGRADLYALGVMLYELTTGRLPFTADDPVAVISQHLHAPVVPPRAKNPQIPAALDALILRLMSKAPQDRPSSAAVVLRELEHPRLLDRDALPIRELSVLERIERGRMVGREGELQQARDLWNQALAGQGQMLLISGEPGIGKSRLVRELATQVEITGGQALIGSCYAEGGSPYAPFRQVIRQVLRGILPQEGLRSGEELRLRAPESMWADLLTLVPDLRSLVPDVATKPPLEPEAERQRFMENLLLFFSALCQRAPVLLALEDIHWADSGTLFLLRHVARNTRQHRLMIAATYREVELDEARPLHEVLLDLQRARLATHLALPRLDRAQTAELLEALFTEQITPDFLDGIYRETEGNPFFIEEVCKALVESGKLYYQDGQWKRPSMEELGIPQSVRVAIQARFGRLPVQVQDTLGLAAVLGRQFDFDTLAQASDAEEDALIDHLETAELAQLIGEVSREGGGTYAFAHALMPSTLVEGLRTLLRRQLHRRAAVAIEARRPDDFEALAYHYRQAGEGEKAVHYALKAGDRARQLYANQEAIDYYQQALGLLKEANDLERAARTLMKLGLTHHTAFDFRQARQAYEEGFVFWRRASAQPPAIPPAPAPHALRTVWYDPSTLDPVMAEAEPLILQLFSGLVEQTPEWDMVPDVASSWQVLDGGRRYVFHLRDDVRWSDGAPVTAGDFEYAWKQALEPVTGSPNANLLYDIRGAQAFHQGTSSDPEQVGVWAADDRTLVFELEGPTGYFLHLLSMKAYPVPKHVVQAQGEAWTQVEHFVSNGPFRLQSWQRGDSMVLVNNPHYHGRFTGNVRQVRLSFLWKDPAQLEIYEADRLDFLFPWGLPIPGEDKAALRHSDDWVSLPFPSTFGVAFDVNRPPFDDRRVRRAFVLATDRERLANVVTGGINAPATGGLVPHAMPGHSPGIGLPYDPEQARGLLAEAGYPDGRGFPSVNAVAPHTSIHYTRYLQPLWRDHLGVDIPWKIGQWSTFLQPGELPHLWMYGRPAVYPDPDNFLRVWSPSRFGWRSERYERLVGQARRMTDQVERMRLYRQAETLLVEEAVILPTVYGQATLLLKPWVRKLPAATFGWFQWKDVILEPH